MSWFDSVQRGSCNGDVVEMMAVTMMEEERAKAACKRLSCMSRWLQGAKIAFMLARLLD